MLFLSHDSTRGQFFVVETNAYPAQQIRDSLGSGHLNADHDRLSRRQRITRRIIQLGLYSALKGPFT